MKGADFVIPIALCGVALLMDVLLLIDSHSILTSSVVKVKKIRSLFFSGAVQSVIYFVEYVLSRYSFFGNRSLGMLTESILYIANLYYIFSYAELVFSKYQKKLYDKKISRFLFLFPVWVMFIMETANIFYPVFFDILPGTFEYVETSWVTIANVIPLLYIAFSGVNDIKEWRDNTHYFNLPISLYFTIVACGIVLEAFFYDYPILPISCCISMILMYNRILKRIGYIDTLSGLFTRSHLLVYINSLLSGKRKAIIAGIMLDVDRFKAINDTYGHVVGDRAIQAVGKVLKQAVKKNGMCFRYGGDEFIIILKVNDVSEIEALMSRIDSAAEEFNRPQTEVFDLSLSKGYAIFDTENDSVFDFVERTDAQMYMNKRAVQETLK